MRSIRIESGNGRSISEELRTAMDLLDGATISYRVNVLVADADEDAASGVFHSARIRFTAGYPLGIPSKADHKHPRSETGPRDLNRAIAKLKATLCKFFSSEVRSLGNLRVVGMALVRVWRAIPLARRVRQAGDRSFVSSTHLVGGMAFAKRRRRRIVRSVCLLDVLLVVVSPVGRGRLAGLPGLKARLNRARVWFSDDQGPTQ